MISIVDYKSGNLGSVQNMLKYLGCQSEITSDPQRILKSDKLIISGVGSFDTGIRNLRKLGLYEVLVKKVLIEKTPVLGICLGMQLMGTGSEEGIEEGFGWIEGLSVKFDANIVRIPQMSWNKVKVKILTKLFDSLDTNSKFYFAHSYHMRPDNNQLIVAESFYGSEFVAAVEKENILGVQFHPEKSHKFGMKLLSNFVSAY